MPTAAEQFVSAVADFEATRTEIEDVVRIVVEGAAMFQEHPTKWRFSPMLIDVADRNAPFPSAKSSGRVVDMGTWPTVLTFMKLQQRFILADKAVTSAYSALSVAEKQMVRPKYRRCE